MKDFNLFACQSKNYRSLKALLWALISNLTNKYILATYKNFIQFDFSCTTLMDNGLKSIGLSISKLKNLKELEINVEG